MMKDFKIAFVIVVLVESAVLQILPPPIVDLPHGGSLRGSYLYSVKGCVIDAFLGIPYAQPPLGRLRFSDPEPTTRWSGILEANKKSEPCMQFDISGLDKTPFGSEDCLYLNVYTPRDRDSSPILPVMVWIHGGAYYFGSSDPLLYGPERLLDNNVILVTFNYRLGALGFMSTQTAHAPGNFGLKDQNLALKWVRENIASFGGNLHDVTLFGHSAGSASISLHMVSPASIELFHKAILQSGNYFDKWAMIRQSKAVERANQLARYLDCHVPSDKHYFQMVNCLRNVEAEKIVSAQLNFFIFPTLDPVTIFGPVVEPSSATAFLDQDPRDIDHSYGDGIPIIIGVTSDEGLVKSAAIIYQLSSEFQSNFDTVLPAMLFYDHKPSHTQQKRTKKIKKFYFKNGFDWSRKNHHNLTNMFSDRLFFAGLDQYLWKRLGDRSAGDTYVYLFDHNGPKSLTEIFGGGPKNYGVCHGDELQFLFLFGQLGYKAKKRDRQMHYVLPKMWTDFAKNGDPTPSDSIITQKWRRASKYPYRYVRIGNQNDYHHDSHPYIRHHHKSDKIESLIAKAIETEPIRDTEVVPDTAAEQPEIMEEANAGVPEENVQRDLVAETEKDQTYMDRRNDFVGYKNAEPEELAEEAYTTATGMPASQWKNSYDRPKKCYIYTKRDPCAILNNKKEQFWTGFTY